MFKNLKKQVIDDQKTTKPSLSPSAVIPDNGDNDQISSLLSVNIPSSATTNFNCGNSSAASASSAFSTITPSTSRIQADTFASTNRRRVTRSPSASTRRIMSPPAATAEKDRNLFSPVLNGVGGVGSQNGVGSSQNPRSLLSPTPSSATSSTTYHNNHNTRTLFSPPGTPTAAAAVVGGLEPPENGRLDDQAAAVQQLKSQMDSQSARLRQMEAKVVERNEQIRKLESDLEAATSSTSPPKPSSKTGNETLIIKNTSNSGDNQPSSLVRTTKSVEMSEISGRYETLEKAYQNYRTKSADILAKKDAHIQRLQDRTAQLEARLTDLQAGEQLHTIRAERDLLQDNYDAIRSVFDAERLEWEEKVSALNKQLAEQKTELEAEINRLRSELQHSATKTLKISPEIRGRKEDEYEEELQTQLAAEEGKVQDLESLLKTERMAATDAAEVIRKLEEELTMITTERNKQAEQLQRLAMLKDNVEGETVKENEELRNQLGEQQEYFENMDLEAENEISDLANQVEDLMETIDSRHRDLNSMGQELKTKEQEIDGLKKKISNLEAINERHTNVIESLRDESDLQKDDERTAIRERDDLLLRNASLSHEVEMIKRQSGNDLDEVKTEMALVRKELSECRAKLRQQEGDIVGKLEDKVNQLEDQVKERDTTIRLQQQRLNDMKKTLQKELRSMQSQKIDGGGGFHLNHNALNMKENSSSTNNLKHAGSSLSFGGGFMPPDHHGAGGDGNNSPPETNFEYLKHVLLRFITSSDIEAPHLVKAVSALLKLTQDEEKVIWETLNWKQSWIPGLPKPRLPPNTRLTP